MATMVNSPTRIQAHGTPPKTIEEYIGRANTGTAELSVARMISPPGWAEPGQTPTFAEFTVVLRGVLQVDTRAATYRVAAGQAIMVEPGEWVRYSTPEADGAEYIAVCRPAFSPDTVQRDA